MEITKDNKVEKKTLQVKKRRYFLTLWFLDYFIK